MPKYLPQHLLLAHTQNMLLPKCERQSYSRRSPLTYVYCRDRVAMHVVHPCLISAIDDDSFTCSCPTETLKVILLALAENIPANLAAQGNCLDLLSWQACRYSQVVRLVVLDKVLSLNWLECSIVTLICRKYL
jgi:hypothetical protein